VRVGDQRQPGVGTAIKMQHLAATRPRLPAQPMATPGPTLRDQSRALERLPHIAVRERDAVLPLCDLMKMPDIEPLVARSRYSRNTRSTSASGTRRADGCRPCRSSRPS
jgi:hypothetical protein